MGHQSYPYLLVTDKTHGLFASILTLLLLVASFLYGAIVRLLIFFQGLAPVRLPCTVISVGNITLGGTGKTVLVQVIARFLKQHGHQVAIISRGYKRERYRSSGKKARADNAQYDYQKMGDEPSMMARALPGIPVLVDSNRIRCAKKAVAQYGVDTVILDDGMQQWRIKKDLEIVCVDALCPFGNRHMLPRGLLRQPLSTLKNADIFIASDSAGIDVRPLKDSLSEYNPQALIFEIEHRPTGLYRLRNSDQLLDHFFLKDKTVTLFCGIGNPDSFRTAAASAGMRVEKSFIFDDHYRYWEEDIEEMFIKSKEQKIGILVTTEKDAVRIPLAARRRFGDDIFVFCVEAKIMNEEKRFFDRLLRIYPA